MSIIDEEDSIAQESSTLFSFQKELKDPTELKASKLEKLETENLILRRSMPRLFDVQGNDVTNTFILLEERARQQNSRIIELECLLGEKKDYKEMKQQLIATYQKKHEDLLAQFDQANNQLANKEEGDRTPVVSEIREQLARSLEDGYNERIIELEDECRSLGQQLNDCIERCALYEDDLKEARELRQHAVDRLDETNQKLEEALQKLEGKEYDIKVREKAIRGLRKMIPPTLSPGDIDWNNLDFDSKLFWLKKLQAAVTLIDPNWQKNDAFRVQLQNFIETARSNENQETVSEIIDNLNHERKLIGKELADVFGSQDSESSLSSFTVDEKTNLDQSVQLMGQFTGLKKIFVKMFETLQGIIPFLENIVSEVENNSGAKELVDKVLDIKNGFIKCINEISLKMEHVNDLERTLNESLNNQKENLNGDDTDVKENERLYAEINVLRTNLKKESEIKNRYKAEIDRLNDDLKVEAKIAQDEKTTLQKELKDLYERIQMIDEDRQALQQQREHENHMIETQELLQARKAIQDLKTEKIAQVKDIEKLLIVVDDLKQQIASNETMLEAKDQEYQERLAYYYEKESAFNLREKQIDECFKKLQALTGNTVSRKIYEDQLKKSETNLERLTRTTMRIHQDCIKYADYLSAIISAATTGNYGNIKRPDVIDESAHAIVMDLLQGTTDELKNKYEYSYNVIKEKFAEIMSSRSSSVNQSLISNVSTNEDLVSTYEEIIVCFEKAEETSNHVVQLAKLQEDYENVREQILNKSRELRHKLHMMMKSFIQKQQQISSRKHDSIVDSLEKIHHVLDINPKSKNMKKSEDLRKIR